MADIHTHQFHTVQQVAATIDALTTRLSDLRQLADLMQRSEAMAAELAAHRQVAAVDPERPRLSDLIKRHRNEDVHHVGRANAVSTLSPGMDAPLSPETIRRTRSTNREAQ